MSWASIAAGPPYDPRLLRLLRHVDAPASHVWTMVNIGAAPAPQPAGVSATCLPMDEYTLRYRTTIVKANAPGMPIHQSDDRMIHEEVKVLLYGTLLLLEDVFQAGLCLLNLDAKNVLVHPHSGAPKLSANVVFIKLNTTGKRQNVQCLGGLFKTVLGRNLNSEHLPAEVQHLIQLMGGDHTSLWEFLLVHPALLPRDNRTDYFLRLQTYTWDVLRPDNQEGYRYLLRNLPVPHDWKNRLCQNKNLDYMYEADLKNATRFGGAAVAAVGPGMAPTTGATAAAGATAAMDAAEDVLKFHRNGSTHGLAQSKDHHRPAGCRYTRADIAIMFYAGLGLFLVALAQALYRLGVLRHLNLRSLFPKRG